MAENQKKGASLLRKLLPIILLLVLYFLGGGKLLEQLGLSGNKQGEQTARPEIELNEGAKVSLPQTKSGQNSQLEKQEEKQTRVYRAEEVAAYIREHGELPEGYLTKDEAYDRGWISEEGNLWEIAPGSSIGGDYFGNREGKLPKKKGRQYFEADVNYEGGPRGAERIVFSNDGLIYYTDDHYESFVDVTDSFDGVKR